MKLIIRFKRTFLWANWSKALLSREKICRNSWTLDILQGKHLKYRFPPNNTVQMSIWDLSNLFALNTQTLNNFCPQDRHITFMPGGIRYGKNIQRWLWIQLIVFIGNRTFKMTLDVYRCKIHSYTFSFSRYQVSDFSTTPTGWIRLLVLNQPALWRVFAHFRHLAEQKQSLKCCVHSLMIHSPYKCGALHCEYHWRHRTVARNVHCQFKSSVQ